MNQEDQQVGWSPQVDTASFPPGAVKASDYLLERQNAVQKAEVPKLSPELTSLLTAFVDNEGYPLRQELINGLAESGHMEIVALVIEIAKSRRAQRGQEQIIRAERDLVAEKRKLAETEAAAAAEVRALHIRQQPFEVQLVSWTSTDVSSQGNREKHTYNPGWKENLFAFVHSAKTPRQQKELFWWCSEIAKMDFQSESIRLATRLLNLDSNSSSFASLSVDLDKRISTNTGSTH